jgi:spore coat protein U-like protein
MLKRTYEKAHGEGAFRIAVRQPSRGREIVTYQVRREIAGKQVWSTVPSNWDAMRKLIEQLFEAELAQDMI